MAIDAPLLKRYLDYPKFRGDSNTIVLLDAGYLAIAECRRGFEKLGHRVETIKPGAAFIERLLKLLVDVKPDVLFTVNHLGFDEEGKLAGLLTDLQIPFASWFVDSPAYILKNNRHNISDKCAVFSWERSWLPYLQEMGFREALFLPLATDPEIFRPLEKVPPVFTSPLSFVGSSMTDANRKWEKKVPINRVEELAGEAYAAKMSKRQKPMGDILVELGESLDDGDRFRDMEAAVVWRTTQEFRIRLTKALIPHGLTIFGDDGWKKLLPGYKRVKGGVNYYRELPQVFNGTTVNINATSFQMDRAVNQRVFDAAACGAFLLTDHQADMEEFFTIGRDAVCYTTPEEAAELARWYLEHEADRKRIASAAREAVLSGHTYAHRMLSVILHLKRLFG